MDIKSIDLYSMSNEREESFFKDCLFVFDSSSLLDFYLYPNSTNETIFNEVFEILKDRLWITSHIEYEYLHNRLSTLKKPIAEKYNPIKDSDLKEIQKSLKEAQSKLASLSSKTRKDDEHPHLEQSELEAFSHEVEELFSKFKSLEENISEQVKDKIDEIKKIETYDLVLESFNKYLKVGRNYTYTELTDIAKEGKFRYEFDIPPGHEDKKDKKGLQIFGDLFIWKQIIEIATIEKKNIALICNDVKIDWCHKDKSTNEKRIASPREELIKELYDASGMALWMYTNQQFLFYAKKYLSVKIEDQQIAKVGQLTLFGLPASIFSSYTSHSHNDYLVFKCDNCEETQEIGVMDLGLYFDLENSYERQMGPENMYEATSSFDCPNCQKNIDGTFQIWEYPVGTKNNQEITLNGAEVLSECELDMDFSDGPDEYDEFYGFEGDGLGDM